jgi:hypothetical protein
MDDRRKRGGHDHASHSAPSDVAEGLLAGAFGKFTCPSQRAA